MDELRNHELVELLWRRFQARDWEGARELLADDFVAEWPHSGERFDADGFIEVNRRYPGDWSLTLRRVVAQADAAVSDVEVAHEQDGIFFAASFFELRDGLIVRVREYWVAAGSEQPPEWRAELGERR